MMVLLEIVIHIDWTLVTPYFIPFLGLIYMHIFHFVQNQENVNSMSKIAHLSLAHELGLGLFIVISGTMYTTHIFVNISPRIINIFNKTAFGRECHISCSMLCLHGSCMYVCMYVCMYSC